MGKSEIENIKIIYKYRAITNSDRFSDYITHLREQKIDLCDKLVAFINIL